MAGPGPNNALARWLAMQRQEPDTVPDPKWRANIKAREAKYHPYSARRMELEDPSDLARWVQEGGRDEEEIRLRRAYPTSHKRYEESDAVREGLALAAARIRKLVEADPKFSAPGVANGIGLTARDWGDRAPDVHFNDYRLRTYRREELEEIVRQSIAEAAEIQKQRREAQELNSRFRRADQAADLTIGKSAVGDISDAASQIRSAMGDVYSAAKGAAGDISQGWRDVRAAVDEAGGRVQEGIGTLRQGGKDAYWLAREWLKDNEGYEGTKDSSRARSAEGFARSQGYAVGGVVDDKDDVLKRWLAMQRQEPDTVPDPSQRVPASAENDAVPQRIPRMATEPADAASWVQRAPEGATEQWGRGDTNRLDEAYGSGEISLDDPSFREMALAAMGMPADALRKLIFSGITPFSYAAHENEIANVMGGILRGGAAEVSRSPGFEFGVGAATEGDINAQGRDDLWATYLGLPQKYETLVPSEYRPTRAKDENAVYSSLRPELAERLISSASYFVQPHIQGSGLKRLVHELRANGGSRVFNDWDTTLLGNFTMSEGSDEKGPYVSYYDKWDLDHNLAKGLASLTGIGKNPPEIYGRAYYDPKTFELIGSSGGGYAAGGVVDDKDDVLMSNGIRSFPRYQEGEPVDLDQEEIRRRLRQLTAERRDTSELIPDPDPPKDYKEFNINEGGMENLLDSLNALVGGNTSFVRRARGSSSGHPTGLYIPTMEQGPLPHWYSFFRSPLGALRVREGLPQHISLTAAGDYASRLAGEGFEMDSSGRPMTEEWSRPERFVAMHEAGHGVDASNIFPESLERMQKKVMLQCILGIIWVSQDGG
jgi:hypothetical protein